MKMTIANTHLIENLFKAKLQTPFVEQALEKLLRDQISQEELELDRLKPRLVEYEKRYNMLSSDFFALYQKGELGDEIDYFEWNVFYKMYLESQKRIAVLRGNS